MADKEIVGWFTRGGKRVPIFKGKGPAKAKKVGSIRKTSDGRYEARSHVKTRSGKTKDPVLGTYDTKERARRRLKTERDMIREEEARRNWNKQPKSFGSGPDGAEYARLASKKKGNNRGNDGISGGTWKESQDKDKRARSKQAIKDAKTAMKQYGPKRGMWQDFDKADEAWRKISKSFSSGEIDQDSYESAYHTFGPRFHEMRKARSRKKK